MTVKAYESARIEYDAYRTDLETTQTGPRTAATAAKAEEAKQQSDVQKEKFYRLRHDLAIKLRFLIENKVHSSFTIIAFSRSSRTHLNFICRREKSTFLVKTANWPPL